MSDSADVMAVLGAIDHEVARLDGDARSAAQARAAELVPPYAEPDAVGWYDQLVDAGGGAGPPDLDRALERLARPANDIHALPRRVAALGAAARAFPDAYGPGGAKRDVMLRALAAPGILATAPDDDRARDHAERCLRLLAEPPAGDPSYAGVLAAGRGLFDAPFVSLAPPCRGKLVDPDRPVIALTTRHRVRGMTLDDARRGILEPANWKHVDGWCDMVPSGSDPDDPQVDKRFLEVVAMGECGDKGLSIAVWLDFPPIREIADREGETVQLVLSYDMSAEQPLPANDKVRTDQGSIAVLEERDHLKVTATKRIGFGPSLLGGKSVALFACSSGYLALGAGFIVQASAGLGKEIIVEEGA
jgi:hypothetical protein